MEITVSFQTFLFRVYLQAGPFVHTWGLISLFSFWPYLVTKHFLSDRVSILFIILYICFSVPAFLLHFLAYVHFFCFSFPFVLILRDSIELDGWVYSCKQVLKTFVHTSLPAY